MPAWDSSTGEIFGVVAGCQPATNEIMLHNQSTRWFFKGLKKFFIPNIRTGNPSMRPPCHQTSGCNCKISDAAVSSQNCPGCNSQIDVQKTRSEIWLEGDAVSGYKTKILDFFENGIVHTEYPGYRPECNFGRDHIAATLDFSCPLPSAPDQPGVNFAKIVRSQREFSA